MEVSLLLHAEFGRNDHQEVAPPLDSSTHELHSPILREYFKNWINVRMMTHIFRYS